MDEGKKKKRTNENVSKRRLFKFIFKKINGPHKFISQKGTIQDLESLLKFLGAENWFLPFSSKNVIRHPLVKKKSRCYEDKGGIKVDLNI
ncbi:MAG: hypothetical protein CM15mP22_7150 [Gammaproteobacteria bacterium]|nr:MAG: hypothetical protein CM15mP22_7150 [Gammaproteobacteria bacterium]